jgi:FKBP-type peptidyl-prolyl cis-trans isomerase
MKKFISIAVAILIASASMSAEKKAKQPEKVNLKNKADSVSYCIGVAIGHDVLKQLNNTFTEDKYNLELILKGLNTSIHGDTTYIPVTKADTIVDKYIREVFAKKEEKRAAQNKNFLAENTKKPGVVTLPNGLQYIVITEGSGVKPVDTSMVKVNYEGSLIDGTVFDSSYKRGQPATFQLNQVIKGWTEGVKLMSVGSKYKLFIPAELGYGAQRMGPIMPNSTLIFTVELLGVEAPPAKAAVNENPAAEEKGSATEKPATTKKVAKSKKSTTKK